MVVFPNCKINLGLHVTEKRPDGYHNLETVFYPLPFYDVLEAIQQAAAASVTSASNTSTIDSFTFSQSGLPVPVSPGDNLVYKAYRLLQADFPSLPATKMHLHKNIPMGAGLGGGSADAAHTLLLLNKKYNLQCTQAQLHNYSLQLGSDCPFFILNTPCFASGRGELLQPIDINLSAYTFILVNPLIHISTKTAFEGIHPVVPANDIRDILQQPVMEWKKSLVNDFEKAIFGKYPALASIKEKLYSLGAVYAAMSGSGSTLFGMFNAGSLLDEVAFQTHFAGCFIKIVPLS